MIADPWAVVRQYPLTCVIILTNVVLYPVTSGLDSGDVTGLFQQMTFLEFQERGPYQYFADLTHTIESGQYWRLLTPMFLHFGLLHIVFNLLWVWEVGRRIELVNGSLVLLLVTLVSSLLANFMQYYLYGPSFFGGMSGVVFGFLGYSLVWSRMVPRRTTGLPPGLYIFMLVYLAVGFTGAIDLLGLGSLANGAHLGGLVGGVLIGVVAGGINRQPG